MTCGMPMDEEICREVIEMVRTAAGPEICAAIDAAYAVDPCEGMTEQERANWIMGVR